MDLILSVLADPAGANMLKHTKLFTKEGGSLGRSADNYWVLPDPERVVSSQHAQISFSDGQFFLTDTSTNGTYHNDGDNPLGKGNKLPLNEGDIINVGDYRLKVTLRQPQTDGDLPKGLGSADFLDTSDRTTFNASAMAKMQSQAEAKQLDNWLEPGGSSDISQSGEWGYIPQSNQNSPAQDNLLGADSGPLDPMSAFEQPQSFGVSDAQGFGSFGTGSQGQAAPGQWSDDEWWKDGSDQDHVPADQHAVYISPQAPVQQSTEPPSSVPTQAPQAQSFQAPPPQPQVVPQPPVAPPQQQVAPQQPAFAPSQAPVTPPPAQLQPQALVPQSQQDNPFAGSFAAMQGQQVAGAPGFDTGQAAPVSPMDFAAQGQSFSQLQQPSPVQQTPAPEAPIPPVQAPPAPPVSSVLAATLSLNMNLAQQQIADQQAAEIVRETVARLIDLLRARSSIKNELRVQRTMIQTEANNPLKFSATERDALEAMFAGNGAFLQPKEAVRDSFDDLSDHQVAVLAGMRAGYSAMLKYFSPDNIERRLGNTSGVFGNKNAKKWEGFSAMYRELVGDPDACYRKLFGDEFAVTYENQLSELKNARQLKN
ncbi:type VI secretion system-associated FHA domain protein TagH [Microbulbifer variabilis]|uniref:type VI secretion system-associated FHA domain protein TagH n=1 Tax=Microbulbifer variabilis TaxID=266805 RepID=UPI001CFD02CE|nr:type VI secretion system-associated FHA domain protein TagH [Microbulbifer variabilis]